MKTPKEEAEEIEDIVKMTYHNHLTQKVATDLIVAIIEQERLKAIDVYAIDVQKLRETITDAEFRRLLHHYLNSNQ